MKNGTMFRFLSLLRMFFPYIALPGNPLYNISIRMEYNMYIFEDIVINEELPKRLQQDIADLESLYYSGQEQQYNLDLKLFESILKLNVIAKKISMSTGMKLLEKYH